MRPNDFKRGAEAAADVAAQYPTTHPYRLDDCILSKLNLTNRKPRRNKHRLRDPEDAWFNGFATALSEMHHQLLAGGANSPGTRDVASAAGLTLARAKASGVSSFDLRELKRAGVK